MLGTSTTVPSSLCLKASKEGEQAVQFYTCHSFTCSLPFLRLCLFSVENEEERRNISDQGRASGWQASWQR